MVQSHLDARRLRLGRGEVCVSFAPAAGDRPALLVFARPAPGVDATPRRVDLTVLSEAERRADWRQELDNAVLLLEADPKVGFDGLLECVEESALTTKAPGKCLRGREQLLDVVAAIATLATRADEAGRVGRTPAKDLAQDSIPFIADAIHAALQADLGDRVPLKAFVLELYRESLALGIER
jgi:hypothetical protein